MPPHTKTKISKGIGYETDTSSSSSSRGRVSRSSTKNIKRKPCNTQTYDNGVKTFLSNVDFAPLIQGDRHRSGREAEIRNSEPGTILMNPSTSPLPGKLNSSSPDYTSNYQVGVSKISPGNMSQHCTGTTGNMSQHCTGTTGKSAISTQSQRELSGVKSSDSLYNSSVDTNQVTPSHTLKASSSRTIPQPSGSGPRAPLRLVTADLLVVQKEVESYVSELIKANSSIKTDKAQIPLTLEAVMTRVVARFFPNTSASMIPIAIKNIPSLSRLCALQGRITAKIIASIATKPIVTMYELQEEVCASEGVISFDELGLGPSILCLELTQTFFNVLRYAPPNKEGGSHQRSTSDLRVLQSYYQNGPPPIRSSDFIGFLLTDHDAKSLCFSGGGTDGVILIEAFVKRWNQVSTDGLASSRPRINSRMSGIHIQNLPWLVGCVKESAGVFDEWWIESIKKAASLGPAIPSENTMARDYECSNVTDGGKQSNDNMTAINTRKQSNNTPEPSTGHSNLTVNREVVQRKRVLSGSHVTVQSVVTDICLDMTFADEKCSPSPHKEAEEKQQTDKISEIISCDGSPDTANHFHTVKEELTVKDEKKDNLGIAKDTLVSVPILPTISLQFLHFLCVSDALTENNMIYRSCVDHLCTLSYNEEMNQSELTHQSLQRSLVSESSQSGTSLSPPNVAVPITSKLAREQLVYLSYHQRSLFRCLFGLFTESDEKYASIPTRCKMDERSPFTLDHRPDIFIPLIRDLALYIQRAGKSYSHNTIPNPTLLLAARCLVALWLTLMNSDSVTEDDQKSKIWDLLHDVPWVPISTSSFFGNDTSAANGCFALFRRPCEVFASNPVMRRLLGVLPYLSDRAGIVHAPVSPDDRHMDTHAGEQFLLMESYSTFRTSHPSHQTVKNSCRQKTTTLRVYFAARPYELKEFLVRGSTYDSDSKCGTLIRDILNISCPHEEGEECSVPFLYKIGAVVQFSLRVVVMLLHKLSGHSSCAVDSDSGFSACPASDPNTPRSLRLTFKGMRGVYGETDQKRKIDNTSREIANTINVLYRFAVKQVREGNDLSDQVSNIDASPEDEVDDDETIHQSSISFCERYLYGFVFNPSYKSPHSHYYSLSSSGIVGWFIHMNALVVVGKNTICRPDSGEISPNPWRYAVSQALHSGRRDSLLSKREGDHNINNILPDVPAKYSSATVHGKDNDELFLSFVSPVVWTASSNENDDDSLSILASVVMPIEIQFHRCIEAAHRVLQCCVTTKANSLEEADAAGKIEEPSIGSKSQTICSNHSTSLRHMSMSSLTLLWLQARFSFNLESFVTCVRCYRGWAGASVISKVPGAATDHHLGLFNHNISYYIPAMTFQTINEAKTILNHCELLWNMAALSLECQAVVSHRWRLLRKQARLSKLDKWIDGTTYEGINDAVINIELSVMQLAYQSGDRASLAHYSSKSTNTKTKISTTFNTSVDVSFRSEPLIPNLNTMTWLCVNDTIFITDAKIGTDPTSFVSEKEFSHHPSQKHHANEDNTSSRAPATPLDISGGSKGGISGLHLLQLRITDPHDVIIPYAASLNSLLYTALGTDSSSRSSGDFSDNRCPSFYLRCVIYSKLGLKDIYSDSKLDMSYVTISSAPSSQVHACIGIALPLLQQAMMERFYCFEGEEEHDIKSSDRSGTYDEVGDTLPVISESRYLNKFPSPFSSRSSSSSFFTSISDYIAERIMNLSVIVCGAPSLTIRVEDSLGSYRYRRIPIRSHYSYSQFSRTPQRVIHKGRYDSVMSPGTSHLHDRTQSQQMERLFRNPEKNITASSILYINDADCSGFMVAEGLVDLLVPKEFHTVGVFNFVRIWCRKILELGVNGMSNLMAKANERFGPTHHLLISSLHSSSGDSMSLDSTTESCATIEVLEINSVFLDSEEGDSRHIRKGRRGKRASHVSVPPNCLIPYDRRRFILDPTAGGSESALVFPLPQPWSVPSAPRERPRSVYPPGTDATDRVLLEHCTLPSIQMLAAVEERTLTFSGRADNAKSLGGIYPPPATQSSSGSHHFHGHSAHINKDSVTSTPLHSQKEWDHTSEEALADDAVAQGHALRGLTNMTKAPSPISGHKRTRDGTDGEIGNDNSINDAGNFLSFTEHIPIAKIDNFTSVGGGGVRGISRALASVGGGAFASITGDYQHQSESYARAAERHAYHYFLKHQQIAIDKLRESLASGGGRGTAHLQRDLDYHLSYRYIWVHEEQEKGTPYDILKVNIATSVISDYYEVKATSTKSRRTFELSVRELLHAARFGPSFHIVRVYNAYHSGGEVGLRHNVDGMRVELYSNVIKLWKSNKLSITGTMSVTVL